MSQAAGIWWRLRCGCLHMFFLLPRKCLYGFTLQLHHSAIHKGHNNATLKRTLKSTFPCLSWHNCTVHTHVVPVNIFRALSHLFSFQLPIEALTPLISMAMYSYPGLLSRNLSKAEKVQQHAKLQAIEVSAS